jgi:outer membrane receptor protein involved in Fe transport
MMKFAQRVMLPMLACAALTSSTAFAQTSTTGAVQGTVRDTGGAAASGAIVVAASPALQGTRAAMADDRGAYRIADLPPGTYRLTVVLGSAQFRRDSVVVQLGKLSTVNMAVDTGRLADEVIEIRGTAPLIDQGSTKTGLVVGADYTSNVPTGRSYSDTLEATPGAQSDQYGVSFAGSTSPENAYVVDGLNTTDPAFGLLSAPLPNEFIQETEIISGGYGAEYGRSTGGLINVITKSGSNQFHGSVFSYLTPGALVAGERNLAKAGSAIQYREALTYRADVGAEVGGPIVKNRLWVHAGINPHFESTTTSRIISRQVDADNDGIADSNPATGATVLEELDSRDIERPKRATFYTGKLTYLAGDNHRGSVAMFGNPGALDKLVNEEFAVGPNEATFLKEENGSIDVAGRWTSEFLNRRARVEAVTGIHRGRHNTLPTFADGNLPGVRFLYPRSLSDFSAFEQVPTGCDDMAPSDPYPNITNCPVINYQVGGVDFRTEEATQRIMAGLNGTYRARAAGQHVIKVGAGVEDNRYRAFRSFSGGTRYWQFAPNDLWLGFEFQTPDSDGANPCGADINGDGIPDASCAVQSDGLTSNTNTLNLDLYLQDSWQVLPNLTLNAGVRGEQQNLGVASHLAGQGSTVGPGVIDGSAMSLSMVAPRIGAIYDWTKEGKSRAFSHWGRYYESIPLDLNSRAFGGEGFHINFYDPGSCSNELQPGGFQCDKASSLFGFGLGDGLERVAPGIRPQFLDEVVAGVEYEILGDTTVGATFIRRSLGRVIDDISPDGSTFIIANPGEVDAAAIDGLRADAAAARAAGDMERAGFLEAEANLYEGVGKFDRPERTYTALQLQANRRFSDQFMGRASYTLSKTRGNYPGLFSPDTGQLDPNFTTMYDLPELMANRYGDLPQDRPHNLKVDGYYVVPVQDIGIFSLGARWRGRSGRPHGYLGSHPVYGQGESFLLPRGSGERGPFESSIDLHLGYGRAVAKGVTLEGFVDVFNALNQQPATRLDEIYTFESTNPIVGGDQEDLRHAKALDATGQASAATVSVNPNFGNPIAAQAPLAMRFGLRLRF